MAPEQHEQHDTHSHDTDQMASLLEDATFEDDPDTVRRVLAGLRASA